MSNDLPKPSPKQWLLGKLIGFATFCVVVLLISGVCWLLEHALDDKALADLKEKQARAQHALELFQPFELFGMALGGYAVDRTLPLVQIEFHEETYQTCLTEESAARNQDYCTKDVAPILNETIDPLSPNRSEPGLSRQALYDHCLFINHIGEYGACAVSPPSPSPTEPTPDCPPGLRCAPSMPPDALLARDKCEADIKRNDRICAFLSTPATFDQWCNEAIDRVCKTRAMHSAEQKKIVSRFPLGAVIAAFVWEGGRLKLVEAAILVLQLLVGAAITFYISTWLRNPDGPTLWGLVMWIVVWLPLGSVVFGSLSSVPVLWVAELALWLFGKSLILMAAITPYLTSGTLAGYITLHATEHKFAKSIEHLISHFAQSLVRPR